MAVITVVRYNDKSGNHICRRLPQSGARNIFDISVLDSLKRLKLVYSLILTYARTNKMNVSTKTKRTVDHKLNELESSTCSSKQLYGRLREGHNKITQPFQSIKRKRKLLQTKTAELRKIGGRNTSSVFPKRGKLNCK